MKKILFCLIVILIPFNINASNKLEVKLDKCVDGDTAWVIFNNEVIKTRFLAINTPESTNKIEEYGKEASEFTCNYLTNTSKLEIEYDNNSDKLDKYNRHLVWVFVDNELLQDLIVKNGLAEIKYIYGDYKYLDILNDSLESAKQNELNLWSNQEYLFILFGYRITKEMLYTFIVVILLIITYIFSKKSQKKITNKGKNIIKKYIKNILK